MRCEALLGTGWAALSLPSLEAQPASTLFYAILGIGVQYRDIFLIAKSVSTFSVERQKTLKGIAVEFFKKLFFILGQFHRHI